MNDNDFLQVVAVEGNSNTITVYFDVNEEDCRIEYNWFDYKGKIYSGGSAEEMTREAKQLLEKEITNL